MKCKLSFSSELKNGKSISINDSIFKHVIVILIVFSTNVGWYFIADEMKLQHELNEIRQNQRSYIKYITIFDWQISIYAVYEVFFRG